MAEEFSDPDVDAEAELWLHVMYPGGLVPVEGKTPWESVQPEIRDIMRGFVMGRRSVQRESGDL